MFDSFHNFKSKLTPAPFRAENKDLAEMLAARIIPKDADNKSYDGSMRSTVTNLLLQMAIPWLASCFEKYSEQQFHDRMAAGFDFILDWQQNHKTKYTGFIFGAKAIRSRFYWNSQAIVDGVVEVLKMRGWTVKENEREALLRTVEHVRYDIYGNA